MRVPTALLGLLLLLACGGGDDDPTTTAPIGSTTSAGMSDTGSPGTTHAPEEGGMGITSEAFEHEGTIPTRFTCDGENTSPELLLRGVPGGVMSLAIIVDDPDAPSGTFVHWVAYDIPPTDTIPEGSSPGTTGRNSTGGTGYLGPCPPSGPAHRYFFTVYALDVTLDLPGGADKEALLAAMEGHVLAEAALLGTYGR
jgi:hypothetical protein